MTTLSEWMASAGPICSKCHKEYLQGHDGLCISCWRKKNEFEYRVPEELSGFLPMSIIRDIVHLAKKEKAARPLKTKEGYHESDKS